MRTFVISAIHLENQKRLYQEKPGSLMSNCHEHNEDRKLRD